MVKHYSVGRFQVDLSRNQISCSGNTQTLAPKALAVLTRLAEQQRLVVSQNTLLDRVWGNVIVSPNTLQRSIAQLRKAMGDDGHALIKTHAKQGYSLECDVVWHHEQPIVQESSNNPAMVSQADESSDLVSTVDDEKSNLDDSTRYYRQLYLVMSVTLVAMLCYALFSAKQPEILSFGELRALTATDHKEVSGSYSPDGQYVVFHRYKDAMCQNTLHAKHLVSQQEFQLTMGAATYNGHSFSPDGKKLVMIEDTDCAQPVTQKICYKLMTMDFSEGLKAPQSPTEMMECKHSAIKYPRWLANNNILLLQQYESRWRLISYNPQNNTSEVMFRVSAGNIISYDYSSQDNLIAVTSVAQDGNYYINLLSITGQLISSYPIVLPTEVSPFRQISPRFSPLQEQLIFSTGRQLFTLSYEGKVENISLLLDEPMGTPIFHPSQKRMLVVKGHYDADIVSMPIMPSDTTAAGNEYTVMERSITGEYDAMVQPKGKLTAFISKRSGEEQVWLMEGSSLRQLTNFPMDTYITGMDWSKGGNSLLVNANHQLTHVYLDGTKQHVPLGHSVVQLFQWDSENQRALANVRINGVSTFTEINLESLELNTINEKRVNWALRAESGKLIYTDALDRFWQSGGAEDRSISGLTEQGSDKRFVLQNNTLFGVNSDFQLWSYSLLDETFKIIGQAPEYLDYISDVDDVSVKGVIKVSANKTLAELFLNSQ